MKKSSSQVHLRRGVINLASIMPRAYSIDLRSRVMQSIQSGLSLQEAARRFQIAPSTAMRWQKRMAETGNLRPMPMGGGRRAILWSEEGWLERLVANGQSISAAQLHAELKLKGHNVSYSTTRRFLLKYRAKKALYFERDNS